MIPAERTRAIISAVAAYHGVRADELISACRMRRLARPRQHAMLALRRKTRLSLPQIGRALGGRDHSTIVYGIAQAARRECRA